MSYLASEQSVHDSQPVELYKFVGTYATYRYTSAPEDIQYDDGSGDGLQTFTAINIERTEVKTGTQEDDNLDITVEMAVQQTVAVDYAFTISPPDLDLTIYRQQPDETVVYWQGPVNNVTVNEGGRAQFRCPSTLGAALTGNIPNVYYQTPCNNVLYGPQCQVPYADWSQVTTVTAVSTDGLTITVGTIGTLDGKLIGGELALDNGERRMVLSNSGTNIVVNYPFSRITVGENCTIAAGCDQNYTGDCKTKFNNQAHFTGFRFIPPINPFISGIEPAAAGVTDNACNFWPNGGVPETGFWAEFKLDFLYGGNTPNYAPGMNLYYSNDGGTIWHSMWGAGSVSNADHTMTLLYPGVPNGGYLFRVLEGPMWPTNPFTGAPTHFHFQCQWGYANIPGNDTDHCYAMISARVPNGAFAHMTCLGGCQNDPTAANGPGFAIGNSFPVEMYFNW